MTEAWLPVAEPRNRGAILTAASALASANGVDSLSAGTLAAVLGRHQAGRGQRVQARAPAGRRDRGGADLRRGSGAAALAAPAGLGQLAAVCEAFFAHLERHTCPGGCFMASAALEMGTRTGPVRDLITTLQAQFGELIRGFAVRAVARDELPPGEDPGRLAFELNGIMLATDTNFVQHDDPAVLELARQIVRQRFGVGDPD